MAKTQHVLRKPPNGIYNVHSLEQFLSNYLSLAELYLAVSSNINMTMLQR